MLELCLARLAPATQGLPAERYEVIVSDDGNAPSAKEVAERFPYVRWTKGPERGPASNRNHGAALSRGEWIVFTDDDCIPDAGWLAAFERAAATSKAVVLEGRTYADRERRTLNEISPLNEKGGVFWSCNLAVRRDAFESLGRFNERFPYAVLEDIELRLRLQKARVETLFVPEAGVCHPWRPVVNDWTTFHRFHESFNILLDIHPEELASYPPGKFVRGALSGFLRETGPQLLKHRSGLSAVLQRHGGELLMEASLLRRRLRQAFSR